MEAARRLLTVVTKLLCLQKLVGRRLLTKASLSFYVSTTTYNAITQVVNFVVSFRTITLLALRLAQSCHPSVLPLTFRH